jgi:hypothetical protein
MHESVDSPHNTHRHPSSTFTAADDSLVTLLTINPWQRTQRTEWSLWFAVDIIAIIFPA